MTLKNVFEKENIGSYACVDLKYCKVILPRKLSAFGDRECTVIFFTVPYYCEDESEANIANYARARDYHIFFRNFSETIIDAIKEKYPQKIAEGFSDNSPLDERSGACMAGLGVIGQNGLLITEEHSSFVFIGEIITTLTEEEIEKEGIPVRHEKIKNCMGCGKCKRECPVGLNWDECLSGKNQKKTKDGEDLSDIKRAIGLTGSAWGCDICALACPYTEKAREKGTLETKVPFFRENRIPYIDKDTIDNMGEEDFKERAFAWRGRKTVLRNCILFEDLKKKDRDKQNG